MMQDGDANGGVATGVTHRYIHTISHNNSRMLLQVSILLAHATAFGFFLYGEIPAWSTFAGAAVIVGATLYLGLRERRGTLPKTGRDA